MKKFLLITGIVVVALFAFLLTAPFLFKNEIKQAVIAQANKQLNATVGFKDVQLSFIRSFPNASVKLQDFYIVGKNEFSKDTLIHVDAAYAVVDIKSFFSKTGYIVKKIELTSPSVYAHVLADGKVNWDIMKPDTTKEEKKDTTKTKFKLSLKKLIIKDARIRYNDEKAHIYFAIDNLNHTLSGDLTAESTVLATTNHIKGMTCRMENVPYLSNATFNLDGDINADLKNMKFTVSKVKAQVNAITLNMSGWFQVLKNGGYTMDLKVDAPDTQFKDILSLIPAIYSKNFETIQTKGKVRLNLYARGLYNDSVFPAFGVNLVVSNAWFKYPALPKSVDKINIAADISNPGGSLDRTKVDVKQFSFVLGNNPFAGSFSLATPISDPDINFAAKGVLNLGMVKEVYPMDSIGQLSGILDANLKLKGKMSYYQKKEYQKFFFDGKLNLSNMVLKTKNLPHDLEIKRANLVFNPKFVDLPVLQMKVGKSDLTASGHLENFIPYFFKNETLKGSLQTNSEYFNVADFMSSATTSTPATAAKVDTSSMKVVAIPSNLDFTLTSSFKRVIYDKMEIANAKGALQMADSKLTFKTLSLSAMGGSMVMSGIYNTKNIKKPDVDIDLKINDVLFTEVFKQVQTVKKLAPIFANTSGRFSSTMTMYTTLGNDMMPVLNTLSGKGVLVSKNLAIKNVKVLHTLGSVLKRDELKDPEIEKVSIPFEIKNGRVYTDPFDINIADTKINVEKGSTGVDQTIDYTMKVAIPTSGNNVFKLSKLGVKIGGTFTSPKISIQTKEMIKDAVATIKQQANKKIEEVKTVAKEQVNELKQQAKENITPNLKKAGDNIKESGKKVLNNLFSK
jgi:hypothetical protein